MTTQNEPIRGKIAKILNAREVALNVGESQGVELGMLFDIMREVEINDPDTGEQLGPVDLPKARIKVSRLGEKVCVAGTYRVRRVNIGGSASLATLFQPPKWETRYETLKVNESFEDTNDELDERNSYVAVGDPVVQVLVSDESSVADQIAA